MDVSGLVWAGTAVFVVGLIVFDFYAHVRTPHEPTFSESASSGRSSTSPSPWCSGWCSGSSGAGTSATQYFAGYVTEKSLSVDNLFVFLIIMTKFAVPRIYQQKVLLVGVVIALVLRTIFILLGAAAIEQFSWVFYIFGAFLVYTAVKLARRRTTRSTSRRTSPTASPSGMLKKVAPDHGGVPRRPAERPDRRQAALHADAGRDGGDRRRPTCSSRSTRSPRSTG